MLPNARLAWFATRFIATARARTQAGAVLCVPAERLASTPTHAMPAHEVPITASAGKCVAATSNVAAVHKNTLDTTILLSERRPRSPGIDSALATAPNPKPAESRPKPPAPRPSWSRAITGSSAHNALAHTLKLKLRLMSERIAGECGTDGAGKIHRDRTERNRLRELRARDETVDARLLGRHVESEAGANHE